MILCNNLFGVKQLIKNPDLFLKYNNNFKICWTLLLISVYYQWNKQDSFFLHSYMKVVNEICWGVQNRGLNFFRKYWNLRNFENDDASWLGQTDV